MWSFYKKINKKIIIWKLGVNNSRVAKFCYQNMKKFKKNWNKFSGFFFCSFARFFKSIKKMLYASCTVVAEHLFNHWQLFLNPPQENQKTFKKVFQKEEPLFSFFEIFTADVSHFLVTKKHFCCDQKVTKSKFCSKHFKNEKVVPFLKYFFESLFGLWEGIKKKFSIVWF